LFGAIAADAIATSAYSNQPNLRIAQHIDTTAFCQADDGFNYQFAGHGYWSASTTMQADIVSVLSGGVIWSLAPATRSIASGSRPSRR